MRDDLDVATTQEIIQSFLQEAEKLILQAESAFEARDVKEFHRSVHTLKSISSAVGAEKLSDHARQLEADANQGRLPSEPADVARLRGLFQTVRPRLAAWMG